MIKQMIVTVVMFAFISCTKSIETKPFPTCEGKPVDTTVVTFQTHKGDITFKRDSIKASYKKIDRVPHINIMMSNGTKKLKMQIILDHPEIIEGEYGCYSETGGDPNMFWYHDGKTIYSDYSVSGQLFQFKNNKLTMSFEGNFTNPAHKTVNFSEIAFEVVCN